MTGESLSIAISTCPNDTFAFGALMEHHVDGPAFEFTLDDIEALNEALLAGKFDVAKASFHAALHLARDYCVLPVGAALGFGVGPLLLCANDEFAARPSRAGDRVLCPGRWTTASLLYRLFCPDGPEAKQVVFSDIMPAIAAGEADYGVVIHEGRFTYKEQNLYMAMDLGTAWEQKTKCPLPLGGIVARKSLGAQKIAQITCAIRDSLQYAKANPQVMLPIMSRYAQEFDDDVLMRHVELYVNDATDTLGETGRHALKQFAAFAREAGIIDSDVDLEIGG